MRCKNSRHDTIHPSCTLTSKAGTWEKALPALDPTSEQCTVKSALQSTSECTKICFRQHKLRFEEGTLAEEDFLKNEIVSKSILLLVASQSRACSRNY